MALMNRESVIQTPIQSECLSNKEFKKCKFERFCDNYYGEFLGSKMDNSEIQDVCDGVLKGRIGAIR